MSFPTPFGSEWLNAILVVDKIRLDFQTKVVRFIVDIYMDEAARANKLESMSTQYIVDKETFVANFDVSPHLLEVSDDHLVGLAVRKIQSVQSYLIGG